MSRALSPVTGKPYGLAAVCRVWRLARSGVYRRLSASPLMAQRRGPLGAMSDEALTTAIRGMLAASPFPGEGHRKVWARWDCREFRAGWGRIGAKEPAHAAPQRPSYP